MAARIQEDMVGDVMEGKTEKSYELESSLYNK